MKAWKVFKWFAWTLAQWAAVWFGLHGMGWAWNAFVFWAWFLFACSVVCAVAVNVQKHKAFPRTVPRWMSHVTDLALALLLAAFGHFGYAVLVAVATVLEGSAFADSPDVALQTRTGEFASRTFASATEASIIAHLRKEIGELEAKPSDPMEGADCLLLLMHIAHRQGYDLLDAAEKKLAINIKRKWGKPNAEGFVEHDRTVEEPA